MVWLWIHLAFGGPSERVTHLLEAGRVTEAVQYGEMWIERHVGDARVRDVSLSLETAVYQQAILMNTAGGFLAFRERFPESKHTKRAHVLEARAGWDAVSKRGSSRIDVETWIRDYDHIIEKHESLTLLADRAYAETRREDTAVAWRLFQDDFPYDARVTTAEAREDKAAYREMRDDGTSEGYTTFLKNYPRHEHHTLVARDVIRKWAQVMLPCSGTPPYCNGLEAGTALDIYWEPPPNYRVTVRLVALFGTETRDLSEAFGASSTQRTGMSAQGMADALRGETWSNMFRIILPFGFHGDLTQSFAFELDLGEGEPVPLPFNVSSP